MNDATEGAPINGVAAVALDIDQLGLAATKDSAEVEIFNTSEPDSPSTGIFIEVWSRDSDEFKKAAHKIRAQAARSPARRAANTQLNQEEEENLNRALSAASVKSWRGVRVKGEDFECTQGNVVAMFTRYPLIQEQVFLFSVDRGNFKPSSSNP